MPVKRANGKDFGQEWRVENHLNARQNNGTQMSRQCPAKVAKSIANTSENNDIQDHQNKLRSKVDDDRTFRQEHHWILSIIGHDGHAK